MIVHDETPCPGREDGIHCEHWYDGDRCCGCGDVALTDEEMRWSDDE